MAKRRAGTRITRSKRRLIVKKTPAKRTTPTPTPKVSRRLMTVSQHVADTLFPKGSSIPRSHPDGQNIDHLVVNILTTGTFRTPIGGSAPESLTAATAIVDWAHSAYPANNAVPNGTCREDALGSTIYVFTPGNLQYSYFPNVAVTEATCTADVQEIASLQDGKPSAIYESIVSNADTYRVIGANLKLHYIGDDNDNNGEIVVQKFDPLEMNFNNNLSDVSVPLTVNEHCKSTKFIPAREGCEVAFFPAHRDGFSTYKQVGGNAPVGTLDATRSLEAIVLRVQGCASANSTAQSWRWELVQTVELSPKPNTLLSRLAHPSPTNNPTLRAITDSVAKHCSDRGHDISSGRINPRMTCLNAAMHMAPSIASQLGSSLPSSGR